MVRQAVGEAYAVRVAEARRALAEATDRGTALVLGLLLAAPAAVDHDTRIRLEDHLARSYELESPGALVR